MTDKNQVQVEACAEMAHEVNRAYCAANGDNTQGVWAHAPQWQKDSAIAGVMVHMANPDMTPEDSHKSWLKSKEEAGWKYGAVKDPEAKEHPCFLPYADLPASEKVKDYLFSAVVRTFMG